MNSFVAPNRIARVAGLALLAGIVLVVGANYAVNFRLIVPGNAAETARNILAHEGLFRLNSVCNVLYAFCLLVLLATLYLLLKPLDPALALLAALCRAVVALMWCGTALNSLGALRFLNDAALLAAFPSNQVQVLARLQLASSYDAYYLGLPFWGGASTLCAWLWFRSRYIPRALAAYGILASAWCVFCALAFLAVPHFTRFVNASLFDLPILLFELALGCWLLVKGLYPPPQAGPAGSSR